MFNILKEWYTERRPVTLGEGIQFIVSAVLTASIAAAQAEGKKLTKADARRIVEDAVKTTGRKLWARDRRAIVAAVLKKYSAELAD